MKKRVKLIYLGLAICLIASMLTFSCAKPAPAPAPAPSPAPAPAPAPAPEPIVLKAITFLPVNEPTNSAWFPLIDTINERAKGELVIESLGGPEVIPGFEQFDALRSGVVDMLHCTENWYAAGTYGSPYAHLAQLTPMELRENGYYDFRREWLKEYNAYLVGSGASSLWFHIFTNEKVAKPWELTGQKIRVAPIYVAFVKALGVTPVMLPPPEIYTALERGVVDGFAWTPSGVVELGWHEVTKYILAPRFYQGITEVTVNLDTWNKIPKHLQDLIHQAMMENEQEWVPGFIEIAEEGERKCLDAGMELIEFSPEDTKWYTDLAYSAGWEDVIEKIKPPEVGPRLKELLTK